MSVKIQKQDRISRYIEELGNQVVLSIKPMPPESIPKYSHGEITQHETVNYRTGYPVYGGLHCTQIFGPINNYECMCGKYKGKRYDGTICNKCGVEVTTASVRRYRMATINLPIRIAHPWFFTRLLSLFALITGIVSKDIKAILHFEKYIIINPGNTKFQENEIITRQEYDHHNLMLSSFTAETGADALYKILVNIDLKSKKEELSFKLAQTNSEVNKKKIKDTIIILRDMIDNNILPEHILFNQILILPPDRRPLFEADNGQFVSSDLNEKYKHIQYRVNRLKIFIKTGIIIFPIMRKEYDLLRTAIEDLYKSISEMIAGKTGDIRRDQLGKRVDYSGRAVITGAPFAKIDECFLPIDIALTIYEPIIIAELKKMGLAFTNKQAKKFIDRKSPEVLEIIQNVIGTGKYPIVLLNRAPTLHRVGIMAFKVILWNKKAIGVNPLVCPAFNADFDGDQMGVHLVISEEAKAEAFMLMRPSKNLGSVASGNLIVGAFRDIALGLYILTIGSDKETGLVFYDIDELEKALYYKMVTIHDLVEVRINNKMIKSSVGRFILWTIFPKNTNITFDLINQPVNNKMALYIMEQIRKHCGDEILAKFVDALKEKGFAGACNHGVSCSIDDFFYLPKLEKNIKKTLDYHKQMSLQYLDGCISDKEWINGSVRLWADVKTEGMQEIQNIIAKDKYNPLILGIQSGARGSSSQFFQVMGMKGATIDSSGSISVVPIISSLRNGMNSHEFYRASASSRRSVIDVSLNTGQAGFFTRNLVASAQSSIIFSADCCTNKYITATNLFKNGELQLSVFDKILGRILAKDIIGDKKEKKILFAKNTLITSEVVEALKSLDIIEVPIRSPVCCKNAAGLCRLCYGSDLSTGQIVALGEPVGIQAAQSIGEPGTQLTMQSFHTGGVANFGVLESKIKALFAGTVKYYNLKTVTNIQGLDINIARNAYIKILNKKKMVLVHFDIPYGAIIKVKDGQYVEQNDDLAMWSTDYPIIAEQVSRVELKNFLLNINYEVKDNKKIIIKSNSLSPYLVLIDNNNQSFEYFLQYDTIIEVNHGDIVQAGIVVAMKRAKIKSIDIVGSLTRVINILENRPYKHIAVLSKHDGVISISKNSKGKNIISIHSEESKDNSADIVTDEMLLVQSGQTVKVGDQLTSGEPIYQDILDLFGIEAVLKKFISDLQAIFNQNGIKVNSKHLEVVLESMCRYCEITSTPPGCPFVLGEIVDFGLLKKHNDKLQASHRELIHARRLIFGITESAERSPSWISRISFQSTVKQLMHSAIRGKTDMLSGLQENIIAGNLIPAGTGFANNFLKSLALQYLKMKQSL